MTTQVETEKKPESFFDRFKNTDKPKKGNEFKNKNDYEKRVSEATRILEKYPDRVPVIVQRLEQSNNIPEIDKNKFLVPNDITLGQLAFIVRGRTKLKPQDALFLFINGKLHPVSKTMSQIYKENKDDDKFLYVFYSGEDTFGSTRTI